MGLTLLEAAKLHSGDVVRAAVIEMFARESDILRVLNFENIQGNAIRYNREAALPGVAFRGVNEAYTASTGVLNPMTESLVISGGDLDVDKFIVDTMGQDQRAVQEALKVKAIAASWTTKFIKGDSSSEPREFDGLQRRLTGGQLIANSPASPVGGSALSLMKLDEAIDGVDSPTHIIMSKAMRRRLTQAERTTSLSGRITYGTDAFGRQTTSYAGLPILVPYASNGGTEPIAFDEAGLGAASPANCTSIYVVSIGPSMLTGIQNGVMDVRDLGELETQPLMRTRVEWYTGLALFHGRCASRLYSITDLAVVA